MPKALFKSKQFQIYLDPQKAWDIIENGRDIDELYPDSFKTEEVKKINEKAIENVLEEGEHFTLMKEFDYDYAITSYGRAYNCKIGRFIAAHRVLKTDILYSIRAKKVSLKQIFRDNKWKFDVTEITSRQFRVHRK